MENPCKIIFFGDSITREYAPDFEKILKEKYPDKEITATNAGVIGETSRDGLKRVPNLLNESLDVVVIGFGMNDWRKDIPKQEFKENITSMVDQFEQKDVRVILLTINPDYQGYKKGTSRVIDEYNCIIRDIAKKKRIKIADVNSLWKKRLKPVQKGLRDKIHPNAKGYKVFYESLLNVVPQSHTTILWQYNGRECRCNYKCPYCYYVYSPKVENYFFGDIEEWRKAFKNCFGKQSLVFYLAFGEPTLGEDFYKVIDMIENEPKWSIRITSNLTGDLKRIVNTNLAKEGRLNINASFHPTQTNIEEFLDKLLFLRKHGIECPIIYVMWPGQMNRFESDFEMFNKHNFLVHVRRFAGNFKGKTYPKAYTDEERRFIAKYCDDATIKYMLNNKPVFNRQTYSGFHFFVVDCTGNIGYDSDCFKFQSKYRTIFGNIIQDNYLDMPLEPPTYPIHCTEGTVDGVSNYLETGYSQLENNNVISFAKQGGVYHDSNKVIYKHMHTDFNNPKIRAEYYFPNRNFKDRIFKIMHSIKNKELKDYLKYYARNLASKIWLKLISQNEKQ